MSKQSLKVPNGLVIFSDLRFVGFWLIRWKRTSPRTSCISVYVRLAELTKQGGLTIPVHATFRMTDVVAAVIEAGREARRGKVILQLGRE